MCILSSYQWRALEYSGRGVYVHDLICPWLSVPDLYPEHYLFHITSAHAPTDVRDPGTQSAPDHFGACVNYF